MKNNMNNTIFAYPITSLGKIPNKRMQRMIGRGVLWAKEWAVLTLLGALIIMFLMVADGMVNDYLNHLGK